MSSPSPRTGSSSVPAPSPAPTCASTRGYALQNMSPAEFEALTRDMSHEEFCRLMNMKPLQPTKATVVKKSAQ
eukprot:13073174-Alexandrium_andersonii.AAC.1